MTDFREMLEKAEEILDYHFNDFKLLETALTHQTFANGNSAVSDNQRLEFLGDAVLDLLSAELLYKLREDKDEGYLTIERSRAVSGEALAKVMKATSLPSCMRIGKAIDDEQKYAVRTLAALCEALFGAIWLDGGLERTRALFDKLIAPSIKTSILEEDNHIDPRGELQALSHIRKGSEPIYKIDNVETDGHNYTYYASVEVLGHKATGTGKNVKKAYADAANALLQLLKSKSL